MTAVHLMYIWYDCMSAVHLVYEKYVHLVRLIFGVQLMYIWYTFEWKSFYIRSICMSSVQRCISDVLYMKEVAIHLPWCASYVDLAIRVVHVRCTPVLSSSEILQDERGNETPYWIMITGK